MAAFGPVPAGHLRVDGRDYRESSFLDTIGKQIAMTSDRIGVLCLAPPPCLEADECLALHPIRRDLFPSLPAAPSNALLHARTVPPPATAASSSAPLQARVVPPVNSAATSNAPQNGTDPQMQVCIVCNQPAALYIQCGVGHRVCDDCLSQYIMITWAAQHQEAGVIPDLRCFFERCGGPPFRATEIARHCSEEAFQVYLDVVQSAKDAQVYADSQRLLHEAMQRATSTNDSNDTNNTVEADAGTALLQRQMRNQFRDGRMCPKCNFGPVLLYGCEDLAAHHGELVGRTTRVDNRCPICGFFSPTVSGWLQWDGVIRDLHPQPRPRARPGQHLVRRAPQRRAAQEHHASARVPPARSEPYATAAIG